MLSADVVLKPQFYDLDPMNVVWHGNYIRYLEQARCALLELIGYSYEEMAKSGFIWPIVDLKIKYVRSMHFGQEVKIRAELAEYEHRLRINYLATDGATGQILTRAQTTQVAVDAKTGKLCLDSPPILIDSVRMKL